MCPREGTSARGDHAVTSPKGDLWHGAWHQECGLAFYKDKNKYKYK